MKKKWLGITLALLGTKANLRYLPPRRRDGWKMDRGMLQAYFLHLCAYQKSATAGATRPVHSVPESY